MAHIRQLFCVIASCSENNTQDFRAGFDLAKDSAQERVWNQGQRSLQV